MQSLNIRERSNKALKHRRNVYESLKYAVSWISVFLELIVKVLSENFQSFDVFELKTDLSSILAISIFAEAKRGQFNIRATIEVSLGIENDWYFIR